MRELDLRFLAAALIVVLGVPVAGSSSERVCGLLGLERSITDGFEVASLAGLTPQDGSRWTTVRHEGAGGSVALVSDLVHSGSRAVQFRAAATRPGARLVKLDLLKTNLCFRQGDELWFRGWYHVDAGDHPLAGLTIWDLEAPDAVWPTVGSINPPEASYSVSPGRRLALRDGDVLIMESKAMGAGLHNFMQPAATRVALPTGRWVELAVHMRLSGLPAVGGLTEVWQDGVRIIRATGQNFPYGGYAVYRSLEVGVSANPRPWPITITVDDVVLSTARPPGFPG